MELCPRCNEELASVDGFLGYASIKFCVVCGTLYVEMAEAEASPDMTISIAKPDIPEIKLPTVRVLKSGKVKVAWNKSKNS